MDNYKVNININKLRTEVQERENRKYKTFEKVLELCYQKILTTNKTSDECCCTFICPQVIFGLPLFNLMECINFIMEKLIEKGFDTHLALPNHIFISWKQKEHENTINQPKYPYLSAPQSKLQIEYQSSASQHKTKPKNNSKNSLDTFNKQKQYRSIDDYHSNGLTNTNPYNNDDISLFQNKIDELFA